MQTRHVLITLLVLAHVLVGLVVWSIFGIPPENATRVLLGGVASSQVGLLAIWTALGRRATPWRLTALISVVVAWSWIVASLSGKGPDAMYFFLPLAATIAAFLASARFFGLRLCTIDAEPTNTEDSRPWQFSLARLFAWTTSLAICMGLLSLTVRHCSDGYTSNLSELPIITIGSTVIVITCLFMTLSALRRQMLIVLLVILLLMCVHGVFLTADYTNQRLFFLLQIPPTIGSLLVCRVAGYRLSWKRKNA